METYCECDIYYNSFKDIIDLYKKKYGSFLKIKSKDITSQKKYKKYESKHSFLEQMGKSVPEKGNECINVMKKCKKNHKNEIDEINSNIEKFDILNNKVNEYHEKVIKGLPEYLDSDDSEDEKEKNKINNKEENEEIIEDSLYEGIDATKTMKKDQQNIVIIQNLLENAELKAQRDEEKREIIKMKNQLSDIWKEIEMELNNQGEIIDNVEDTVDKGLDTVKDANDQQLVKAAKSAVTRRRLGYQLGLGAVFCAIGTVVPGVGNVVGAALGGLIGYGIHRIDKHRLNKALEKQKKMRKKNNNK